MAAFKSASVGCAAQPCVAGKVRVGAQTAVGLTSGTFTDVIHELTDMGVVGVVAVSVICVVPPGKVYTPPTGDGCRA